MLPVCLSVTVWHNLCQRNPNTEKLHQFSEHLNLLLFFWIHSSLHFCCCCSASFLSVYKCTFCRSRQEIGTLWIALVRRNNECVVYVYCVYNFSVCLIYLEHCFRQLLAILFSFGTSLIGFLRLYNILWNRHESDT